MLNAELTDEFISKVIDEVEECCDGGGTYVPPFKFARALHSALRAQADAQPVAWEYADCTGSHISKRPPVSFCPDSLSEMEVKVTPLYTHPAPEAAQVAQWQWRWKGDEEWRNSTEENCSKAARHALFEVRALYGHPAPEATQAGLSDEDILAIADKHHTNCNAGLIAFARSILTRASAATKPEGCDCDFDGAHSFDCPAATVAEPSASREFKSLREWDRAHLPAHAIETLREKEAIDILTNAAQILDVVKQEWMAEGAWSDFDQSVRNSISAYLTTRKGGING